MSILGTTKDRTDGRGHHSHEAAANARAFVMLILQWAADDDERAKVLLAKCEADEVE